MLLAACGRAPQRYAPIAPGATVLAFGDSLTFGTGAPPQSSYPAVLTRLTGWNVINAGVPGDTAPRARERLPALLDTHAPALVLLGIGGNDFLRRLPEEETRVAIGAMLRDVQTADALPLLIAVPRPSVAGAVLRSLSDHPLYAELAAQYRVPLLAGAWSEILSQPALKADQIHANENGYAQFAQRVQSYARESGLLIGR